MSKEAKGLAFWFIGAWVMIAVAVVWMAITNRLAGALLALVPLTRFAAYRNLMRVAVERGSGERRRARVLEFPQV